MLNPTLSGDGVAGDASPNLEHEDPSEKNMDIDEANPEIAPGFRHNALVVATFPWTSGIVMAPTWLETFHEDHFAFVS